MPASSSTISSSDDEEEHRCLGDLREELTVGAARDQRALSLSMGGRREASRAKGPPRGPVRHSGGGAASAASPGVGQHAEDWRCSEDSGICGGPRGNGGGGGGGSRQRHGTKSNGAGSQAMPEASESNRRRGGKGKGRPIESTKRAAAASRGKVGTTTAAAKSRGSRARKPAINTSSATKPAKKKRPSSDKKRGKRKTVTGILGMRSGFQEEDSDYDDSEDENYAPPASSNASFAGCNPATRIGSRGSSRNTPKKKRGGKQEGGRVGADLISRLSREVILSGIVRPYLCTASKCALQRTCKNLRQVVDMPQAWQTLDLRADVIGRRTMKSGRQSIMSSQPLFFLARSIILQPRFSHLTTVDLRGLNLGAMGSVPDLLVTLFQSCRNLTTLNLWNTYIQDAGLPQPESSVEKVIAQHLPGVRDLALEMDASNKGLKLLLEGCTSLKSLHIGSRCNRRGDSISMYPNDRGMEAFRAVGAPCLETLSLVDKINIGAVGLRCLLEASSCPRLTTLILVRANRVNDNCLKAIAPVMGRISSLTLDQCIAKPSTVKLVLERCPEMTNLVVSTQQGILEKPQEGRALLDFLVAESSTKLRKVEIQSGLPQENAQRQTHSTTPPWLGQAVSLQASVLGCLSPRIAIGEAQTAYERIAPFMSGG